MKFEKIPIRDRHSYSRTVIFEMLTKTHPLVIWGLYLLVFVEMPGYAVAKLGY